MTIDEAIQHCIEKAEENNVRCADYPCAMEHIQLAKWLVELKEYKEQKTGQWMHERLHSTTGGSYPITRCSKCKNAMPFEWTPPYCPNCGANMVGDSDGNNT